MDTLETQTPEPVESNSLRAECDALRQLVVSLLVLILMLSGTLAIFLLRQYKNTNADLDTIRPQVAAVMTQYQKSVGPVMDEFIRKVTDYGHTHPDFAPIMTKYGLGQKPAPGATPALPTASPMPGAKK